MTLYIGNDEISKKIILENISGGIDLPEISEITKGKILGNDGSTLSWVDESDYIASEFNQTLDISSVTNCITKIPQDIKLELTDGRLTLKAGSKVYKGDGSVINISSDISSPYDFNSTNVFVAVTASGKGINFSFSVSSGDTPPEGTSSRRFWYDTTNKIVKNYAPGSSDYEECSLPIAVVTVSGGAITSIDQVFNGFGYIGSTVFALPGVEGLIPNGRNVDGSLNNIKFTTTDVITYTPTTGTYNVLLVLTSNRFSWNSTAEYLQNENRILNRDTNTYINNGIILGYSKIVSGRITSFNPKTTFQAVDRNDTEWASTASKPSDRYVDLTLQASGASYTAPANGWFYTKYTKNSESATQSMILGFSSEDIDGFGNFITMGMNSLVTNTYYRINQPIKAGKKMRFSYQKANTNDTIVLGFCYDEGAK